MQNETKQNKKDQKMSMNLPVMIKFQILGSVT